MSQRRQPNRRFLIVGEGRETEYNYFVGLRTANKTILDQMAISVEVVRGKGRSAKNIVEHAIKEKRRFVPDLKKGDRVFLVMDTEGSGRAPELPDAERLARKNDIQIIYSCPAIEYWLRCHFPACPKRHFENCEAVRTELDSCWNDVCKSSYHKADPNIYNRLESNVDQARIQALDIDLYNIRTQSKSIRVNPSTQVYELIALLLGSKTGEKCPVAGDWMQVGNPENKVSLRKGDRIPLHQDVEAHWQLVWKKPR